MAPRDDNLIKHLKLALGYLEDLSKEAIYSIEDETFDLLDKILAEDLKDVARDCEALALATTERITEVEAALCHAHLSKILRSLILATRISRATWPSPSLQMLSLITSRSPTETSTDSRSPQTSAA